MFVCASGAYRFLVGVGMAGLKPILMAFPALILLGMAGEACAAQFVPLAAPPPTYTSRDAFATDLNQWGPQAGHRSLQWDSKTAHWGVKLDVDPPTGRALGYTDSDVRAGAYYKITPSLRVGGAVSLGPMTDDPRTVLPPDRSPKVRLETALKF